MSNVMGIAYCGGIMTCSGYSAPHKYNLSYDNTNLFSSSTVCLNGLNPKFDVTKLKNKTNADAFVYTNCDKDCNQSQYGSCSADTPASKLYVVKSSCSPHMFCTYDNRPSKFSKNIISRNDKIWAKKINGRHDVDFDGFEGMCDYRHLSGTSLYTEMSEKYRGINATKIVPYTSDSDAIQWSYYTSEERGGVISGEVNTYISTHPQITGTTIEIVPNDFEHFDFFTTGNCTVEISGDSSTKREIPFSSFTDSLTYSGDTALTAFYGSISNDKTIVITKGLTNEELLGCKTYLSTKRLDLLESLGTSDRKKFESDLKKERADNMKSYIKTKLSTTAKEGLKIKIVNASEYGNNKILKFKEGEESGETNVAFTEYTSTRTASGTSAINTFANGITDSGWTLQIVPNITSGETSGYTRYVAEKTSSDTTFSRPKVLIYADKTILSDYNRFGGNINNYNKITNYASGKPYEDSVDSVITAEFSFINDDQSKWKTAGSSILYADVPTATTKSMFEGCADLITCDIPCQMRYINAFTFRNCTSLSSYTTNPNHVDAIGGYAFDNSGIKEAIIGKYTVLEANAFNNANQITAITWNDFRSDDTRCRLSSNNSGGFYWHTNDADGSYESAITSYAFCGCARLTTTSFVSGNTRNDITGLYIPKGFKVIGESAFENCYGLNGKNVWLNNVTRIHKKAFYGCRNLHVYGNTNVEYFGKDAMTEAENVYVDGFSAARTIDANAYKGKTIYAIDSNAESAITYLPNIQDINDSNAIGYSAFENATIAGGLKISNDYTKTIGEGAFRNCAFNGNSSSNVSGVTISGNGICYLDDQAFYNSNIKGNLYLRNVDMFNGNGETFDSSKITGNVDISGCVLSDYCFRNAQIGGSCSITANSIGRGTFSNSKVNVIDLHGVSGIDAEAFSACPSYNVSAVTLDSVIPPQIGGGVFDNSNGLIIKVPCNSVKLYQISPLWNEYASKIYNCGLEFSSDTVNNEYIYYCGDKYEKKKWKWRTSSTSSWSDSPLTVERGNFIESYSSGCPSGCTVAIGSGSTTDKNSHTVTLSGWSHTINFSHKINGEYSNFPSIYADFDFYESYNHDNDSSGNTVITINNLSNFTFYFRNSSELSYDYVVVSDLDNFSSIKLNGSGNSSWKQAEFKNIDGKVHKILVCYKKDSSVSTDYDKGYIAIPKNQ